MFDFPAGATPGQIFEPNGAGTEPSYTFDGTAWIYGATTELLISSLIPNSALCGSAVQTVRALGANFTATCELLLDGVAQATTFVSVSELSFQINPVPETVPRTAIVTVRDGATLGVGAVPFSFNIVTTYVWNIGIDETAPGVIDVRVANTNNEIGGITVTPRDATTQGLALDLVTGALAAPPATPLLMGVLTEPPADSKGYVRQTTGASSTWVPPADTPLPDAGIGLTVDLTTPPGVLNLDIANTNGEIGGVMTVPRTDIQGLNMDATGLITVPLATPALAGALTEPPNDSKGYVRQTTGAVSTWVPPATTQLPDFGIGLSLDTSTDPDIVHLTPAGWDAKFLGGVYTKGGRSATEGLDLAAAGTGQLSVPLATNLLAGSIVEPPPNDIKYMRRRTAAGVSAWVEADAVAPLLAIELIVPNTAPVGAVPLVVEVHGTAFTSTTVAIVDGAAKATTYVSPTELMFQIDPSLETVRMATVTVQDTVGPVNGTGTALFHFVPATALYRGTYSPSANLPDIWAARQLGYMWIVDTVDPNIPEFSGVPGLAGLALNEGDHLVYDGTQYNLVDGNQTASMYQGFWKPATNVPTIDTMVKYPGYMWIADTNIPNTPESPPAGFPDLAGLAIYEGDQILWDGLNFKLMQGVLVPNYRGLWNVATNTPPIDAPAVGNNKPNWMWIAKTVDPLVPEVAPATIPGIGGMTFREGDHVVYDKPNNAFIKVLGSGGAVNPAGATKAEIGVVFVPARTNMQALTLNVDGQLTSLLATPQLAGAITEPPPDDKGYVRRTLPTGGSSWVPPALPPASSSLVPVGRSPENGLENSYDTVLAAQTIFVPLGTDLLAGSIVEPPADDLQYVRSRSVAGVSTWVLASSSGMILTADTPPAGVAANTLWWDSDSGDLFVNYQDVDSTQWVQINTAAPSTSGITDAPSDGTPYSRQDAGWVAAAAGGGGLADAPADGTEYLRKDNAWVNPTAAAGAFLPLTGGTITGDLAVTGNTTLGPTLNTGGLGLRVNTISTFGQIEWANALGVQSTMFINDGRLVFAKPGGGGDIIRLIHATQVADFANRPTVNSTPVVMMDELTARDERIAALEERLARLEAR